MIGHYILDIRFTNNPPIVEKTGLSNHMETFELSQNVVVDLISESPQSNVRSDSQDGLILFQDGFLHAESQTELSEAFLSREIINSSLFRGLYNLILIDANRRRVQLINDSFGNLPCYYSVGIEGRVIITNSLMFLKKHVRPSINIEALSERILYGWAVDDKTVFENVFWTKPGSNHVFEFNGNVITKTITRLTKNWVEMKNSDGGQIIEELHPLLQQACLRYTQSFSGPFGIMLSGGLDSRLVIGELSNAGAELVACTHGNDTNWEFRIARQVADACNIPFHANALNEAYSFETLAIEEAVFKTDICVNPMWLSSIDILLKNGVSSIATGGLGDSLLGGSYYKDVSNRRRFLRNLGMSLRIPLNLASISFEETVSELATKHYTQAARRINHWWYNRLFDPDIVTSIKIELEKTHRKFKAILEEYSKGVTVSGMQLRERFECEHRDRKLIFGQERMIRSQTEIIVPLLDRDVCALLTNVGPDLKYDHHLYYRFFKRYYPKLAQIYVPNYYSPVSQPQLLLELRRVAGLFSKRVLKNHHRIGWFNFGHWIWETNNATQLRDIFLKYGSILNEQGVNDFFNDVSNRQKHLSDGTDILGVLSAAMLVHDLL